MDGRSGWMERRMDGGCKLTLLIKSDRLRNITIVHCQSNESLPYARHKVGGCFEKICRRHGLSPQKKLQSKSERRQYINYNALLIKCKIM